MIGIPSLYLNCKGIWIQLITGIFFLSVNHLNHHQDSHDHQAKHSANSLWCLCDCVCWFYLLRRLDMELIIFDDSYYVPQLHEIIIPHTFCFFMFTIQQPCCHFTVSSWWCWVAHPKITTTPELVLYECLWLLLLYPASTTTVIEGIFSLSLVPRPTRKLQ